MSAEIESSYLTKKELLEKRLAFLEESKADFLKSYNEVQERLTLLEIEIQQSDFLIHFVREEINKECVNLKEE